MDAAAAPRNQWPLARLCDTPSRVIVRRSNAGGLASDDGRGTGRVAPTSTFTNVTLRTPDQSNPGQSLQARWTEAVPWGF